MLLIDVASGRTTHRLEGRFAQVTWADDDALLLVGPEKSPKTQAWRAPWTVTTPETLDLGITGAVSTTAGLLGTDESQGCLKRLDSSLKVVEASCGGWSVQGRVSPDGRYVPVEWKAAGDKAARAGVLDMTSNQVSAWPVDGGKSTWLGMAEVLLTPAQSEDVPDQARCVIASGTCERVPVSSLTALFHAATWLATY